MAVTKSSKQTVKSPDGNSLAIFVDISDGTIKLKDINGNVENLSDYINDIVGEQLQILNGQPLTDILQFVSDSKNTSSQLKLSTILTQVTGVLELLNTLRITTDSEDYIDIEDGSTNNRFTISRPSLGQKVVVDFASNPSGSTTTVGAIRTYQDGVLLSDIMTFREDGLVSILYGLNLNASKLSNFTPDLPSTAVNLTINSSNSASYNCAVLSLSGAINVSVDNTVPDGFSLTIVQLDANQCTIVAGSGLTLRNRLGNTKSAGQWAVISIVRLGSNLILTGDTGV